MSFFPYRLCQMKTASMVQALYLLGNRTTVLEQTPPRYTNQQQVHHSFNKVYKFDVIISNCPAWQALVRTHSNSPPPFAAAQSICQDENYASKGRSYREIKKRCLYGVIHHLTLQALPHARCVCQLWKKTNRRISERTWSNQSFVKVKNWIGT